MVGWHHRLNGHEFEQTLGDGEGQGSLACCSPWGRKESDTTERLNSTNDGHSFYPLKGVMQHKCKLDKLGCVCVCVCVCSNPVLFCVTSLWLSSPTNVNSFRGIGFRSPKSLPYSLLLTYIHVCPCGLIHLKGNC